MDYSEFTDEEVITYIRNEDSKAMEYLIDRYSPLVKKSKRALFLMGADSEDLSQEGMIGLFKAIMKYDSSKDASFFTFARMCIQHEMLDAVTAAGRKKHMPLNNYISFYAEKGEEGYELLDRLEAPGVTDPELIMVGDCDEYSINERINKRLSKLEKEVLRMYIDGLDCKEIAKELSKSPKSIYNAIQRIKQKLKKDIDE